MFQRNRNFIRGLVAAASLGLLSVSVCCPSASAAASTTQVACSDYTNSKVWQTSAQWSRVSERVCLEWTAASANGSRLVRGRWQFRVDWPTDCSLSVGLPPAGGISCPAGRAVKNPSMTFKNVIIDGGWRAGSGPTSTGRCSSQNWYTSRMQQATYVRTCNGPWMRGTRGSSFTISLSAQADVADDGDGQKLLGNWIRQSWTFPSR